MNAPRRHAFTLLELVISCAILVTVFAFAASALTRIHRLRIESESQTRLMTEGRALLDDLADQFAHYAGNFYHFTDSDDAGDRAVLAFVRYAPHPLRRTRADAADATPYRAIHLDFRARVELLGRRAASDSAVSYSNGAARVAYDVRRRDSATVTNAVSADEMGTHIPAAPAGATISVPVTSGSSVTTYGSRTSRNGHVAVLPSPSPETNAVVADVTFDTGHAGDRILTIRKPVAGRWPPPATRVIHLRTVAETVADNLATNAFMTPGLLLYTNVPAASAAHLDDETNATARTTLHASVTAFDSLPPSTADIPAVSEAIPVPSDAPYVSSTNGLVSGELLYDPSYAPLVVTNYWTWGDGGTVNTNNILSGLGLVINGRTNTYASAADVAASAAAAVTHADANFQFAEIFDLLGVDLDAGGGTYAALTNLVLIAEPVAFTNVFSPTDATGALLPLAVTETVAYEEQATPVDFTAALTTRAVLAAAGATATPLLRQAYRRELDLDIERVVTPSGMTLRVAHDLRVQTRYDILSLVPAALVPTNALAYGGVVTNFFPNGTSCDSETRWHDIVLDDDFSGANERTTGIWLREEGTRDITELHVRTNATSHPYIPVPDAYRWLENDRPAAWRALQSVVITPLCFATNENRRLDLVVWDPFDHPPGPPVCADIYLELLSEPHRRRAAKLGTEDERRAYIQNHVIRLTRRALIGTAKRELP